MTIDETFYRAPASLLERPVDSTARSLEDAIEGRWDFDLGELLSESWDRTKGSKFVLLLAVGLTIVASGVSSAFGVLQETHPSLLTSLLFWVTWVASIAVSWGVNAGMTRYAIRRAAGDERASFDDIIAFPPKLAQIVVLYFTMSVLVLLGLVCFVLPGIYLLVGYSMALGLVMERDLGVWEALETSRKAIHHHWFKVAALGIVGAAAVGFGAAFTFGIGLIWLYPFWWILSGMLYREIFGTTGRA